MEDRMENYGWVVGVVLILMMVFGSIAYYANEKSDCDARGGVLVRSVTTNLYQCVSPLPER
jgi:hypothetical protein